MPRRRKTCDLPDSEKPVLRRSSRIMEKKKNQPEIKAPILKVTRKRNVKSKVPKVIKRESVGKGWNRGFDKYSPSKEIQLSPVKCTQGTIQGQYEEPYLDMFLWAVSMSEQHYYDNAFLLLSYVKYDHSKMAKILHRGFVGVDMRFFKGLDELVLLGQGAFGSVYSCRDPATNIKYAVKHILGKYTSYTSHFHNLFAYMSERNANIRAMDSPFIVKFCYSLQIQSTGDFFLFLEYCIGDLDQYITTTQLRRYKQVSLLLYENIYDFFKELYSPDKDFLEVNMLYVFEIFCGLDFLVKCNIIHQDFKPQNVMISNTLHLKIGDFGLAYKTRTIHKKTNAYIINASKLEKLDEHNYERTREGTLHFQDFEIQMMFLERNQPLLFQEIVSNPEMYDAPGINVTAEVLEPTFLVDTWAAGVTALMILYRGFIISYPDFADEDVYPTIPKNDVSQFIAKLFSQQTKYFHYVERGLIFAGGSANTDLMQFLASIFKPRLTRCSGYTKEKEIYHYSRRVKMRYVDLDKIEQLEPFKTRNFNRNSIGLRSVSEKVRRIFREKTEKKTRTFEELLQEIEQIRSNKKILNFNPGVMINFF